MSMVTKGMTAVVGMIILAFLNSFAFAQNDLEAEIRTILEESAVAGAGIVVVENGAPSVEVYWGKADVSADIDVTPDTTFRAGSISKNVTSLIALRLIEQGQLDPYSPVSKIAPDIQIDNQWADDAPVLIIHLLEHTAGLPGSSYREYSENKPDATPSEYLDAIGRFETRWPPGTLYSYSNAGHTILARVLEVVSGQDFDTLAKDEVFDPLGMTETSFATYGVDPDRLSKSYTLSDREEGAWEMMIRPSGSLVATPRDMAKLVSLYATDGSAAPPGYLAEAAISRMRGSETGETAKAGVGAGAYGMGTFAFIQTGTPFYGHWGKTEGFRANMGYLPGTGSGFVIMLNVVDERAAYRIREAIATYLTRETGPADPVRTAQIDTEAFSDKAGHYVLATHNMPMRDWLFKALDQNQLSVSQDGLIVSGSGLTGGSVTVFKSAANGGFVADGVPIATATFSDIEGKTYWVDRDAYVKVSALEASFRKLILPAAILFSLIAVLHGIVWGLMGMFGRGPSGLALWTRSALLVSGLGFVVTTGLFAIYGLIGSWDSLAQVGQVSLISILLAISSLMAVFGAFGSLALVGWRAVTDRSLFLVYAIPASLALSGLAFIWLTSGWAPLITWSW